MSMKLENNIGAVKRDIESIIKKSARELGIMGTAEIQSRTPVKTGALKRSTTYRDVSKNKHCIVEYGSSLYYAPIVNFRGRHRKYFTRALKQFVPKGREHLRKKLKGMRWSK